MTVHVPPIRAAVLFDGDQNHIRGMAKDVVGQLADTAKSLGRSMLVCGAQTMDLDQGQVINWSGWVSPQEFDRNETLRLAHCSRTTRNHAILDALNNLAVQNETFGVDVCAPSPRFAEERIDAALIMTGRDRASMDYQFNNQALLNQVLRGM